MNDIARHFDEDYREVVTLRDGSQVLLRLVHPRDKSMLARGLAELSNQSRYLRFFSSKRALSEAELHYLTEVDQQRHFAMGAVSLPDESRGLGVARFVCLPGDDEVADPAIAVVDDMHGKGLGRLLFLRLIAAARERDVVMFRAEVLAQNVAMRQLLQHLSPATVESREGELVVVRMPLPQVDPHETIQTNAQLGVMYRLFSLAAEGLVRIRRVLNILKSGALPHALTDRAGKRAQGPAQETVADAEQDAEQNMTRDHASDSEVIHASASSGPLNTAGDDNGPTTDKPPT